MFSQLTDPHRDLRTVWRREQRRPDRRNRETGMTEIMTTTDDGVPPDAQPQASDQSGTEKGADTPSRVLVIDDDDLVRGMILCTLTRAGFDALGVSHGGEGMDAYRAAPFDVVITDIFMPVQDGLGTIVAIRREFPDARIIAISGGGFRVSRDFLPDARKLGAQRTLAKPVSPPDLLDAVHDLLETEPPVQTAAIRP